MCSRNFTPNVFLSFFDSGARPVLDNFANRRRQEWPCGRAPFRSPATNSRRSNEIQLSFRITIYNSAEKPRRILAYESTAHVGLPFPSLCLGPERRNPRSFGSPPVFRLQGGPPSLDIVRSRADTYTRPLTCNHPPGPPSFFRMTFRLSCCANSTDCGTLRRRDPMVPSCESSRLDRRREDCISRESLCDCNYHETREYFSNEIKFSDL